MQKQSNVMHGVKWGVIIGLVYCLIIYLRYSQGADNFMFFTFFTVAGFLLVLTLLLISGFQRRKAAGGFIELKDIFQTLFVTVLIFELFYVVFDFIYLKSIDPDFFRKLKDSMERMMEAQGVQDEKVEKQLEKIDTDTRKLQGSHVPINYLKNVAVMGVFSLIFSLIIRRRRPPFQEENSLQTQP